jgi:hypothetical protein
VEGRARGPAERRVVLLRVTRFTVVVAVAFAALACGLPPAFVEISGGYAAIGVRDGLLWDGSDTGPHDIFGRTVVVRDVQPGSPAAGAGIVPGDTVARADLDSYPETWSSTFVGGLAQLWPGPMRPGVSERFSITHGAHRRFAVIVPRQVWPTASEALLIAVTTTLLVLGVGVAAVLVLLRPVLITWALYAYTLHALAACPDCNGPELGWAIFAAPPALKPYVLALIVFLFVAGDAAFVIFLIRFPTGLPLGRWRIVEALAVPLIVSSDAMLAGLVAMPQYVTPAPPALPAYASDTAIAIAGAAFVSRYVFSSGDTRQRLRWVAIGVLGAVSGMFLSDVAGWTLANSYDLSSWIAFAATILYAPFPFTVLYAATRHRVIDVAFVLNRAVVFTLLASLAVVLFAVVDWYLSRNAATSRIELAVDVAIALLLGFSFGACQRKLTEFVDAALFRRRYRRQRRLDDLADRVYSLTSRAAMGAFLTRDLPEVLEATSAALFERLDDGGYLRGASSGWPHDAAWHLLPDQVVVQRADAAAKPASIDVEEWYDGDALPEASRPAIAVPIIVAHRPRALLLLGPHRNGADFDASEVGLLKSLAARVASVYGVLLQETPLVGALTA